MNRSTIKSKASAGVGLLLPLVFFLSLAIPACNRNAPSLVDLDGQHVDLWKSPTTTVAIFTRTDCPIANRYAPEIRKLHEQFASRSVAFFLIYVDARQSNEEIRQHLKEYALPCPALRDVNHSFAASCGATVTPEAVVFASDRKMVYCGRIDDLYADLGKARPEATTHELAEAIEATLLGNLPAVARTKAVGCLIADLK